MTPLNPNFELTWFQTYTSIIHGVKGVVFYELGTMYAHPNDNLRLPYNDAARQSGFSNTSDQTRFNRIPRRSSTSYMPADYDFFLRYLSRELRYLKDRNLLSTDPASVVCSKTTSADVNGILPPCSTYLPNQITTSNSKGLYPCTTDQGIWQNGFSSPQTFLGQNDERFGLRYTIRTNGNQVIMIISNPTPFYVNMNAGSNTGLDFTNVANDFIRNSVGVNVLFEGASTDPNYNYTNSQYKTSRNSTIVLNGTSNPGLGVENYIAFNGHKLNLQFAPYDVHVLEFVAGPNYQVNGYNNGWNKVWSNNGSSNMQDWHFVSTDKKLVGDFDGNGSEDLLMIQDPNIPAFSSWANMYTFYNGQWNWMWSNNGSDHIGSWGVREFDYYITGNFVKESSGPQKTEVLVIQKNDQAQCWASLYQLNTGQWTQLWSNNGSNWLGSWNLLSSDKWVVGDFNNDGQDDLISVQGFASPGAWAMMNTFNSLGVNWNNLWTNAYSEGTGKVGPWSISTQNQFYGSKYNGTTDRAYLLCFDGTSGTNQMLKFSSTNGPWIATPYLNTTGSLGGISVNPINTTDKYLCGDIDDVDTKDEFLYIQRGSNASWSVSEDLNSSMNGWNWNWVASPSGNCSPYICYPYINDWPISDQNGSNTDYLLIKAIASDPKYLMAFRSYGANNNYWASMYKSTTGTNKRQLEGSAGLLPFPAKSLPESTFSVYPNPSEGLFRIEMSDGESIEILRVYDAFGKIVFERYNLTEHTQEIDLTSLTAGMYSVNILSNGKLSTKKIIVGK